MDPDVVPTHYDTIFQDLSERPSLSVSLPTDELFGPMNGFYSQSDATPTDENDPMGTEWQRLASFEYIDPNDAGAYSNENGEITVSGASSRRHGVTRKHNMRLRFKARNSVLGSSTFRFANAPFTTSPVRDFVQMQLRNPTHDSWGVNWSQDRGAKSVAVREAWARKIHRDMDPPSINPNGDPTGNLIANRKWVHLYLNGLYWGIYELTERVDEDMGRAYGDPNADYDVISQSGVVDGTDDAYNQLILAASAAANSPNDNALWQVVVDTLDCPNYVDYLIVNMFMQNDDWPGNNWRAMRRRAPGAKYKFIVWDAEFAFDSTRINSDSTGRDNGAARIHGILIDHPNYEQLFKDRVALHFNTPGGAFSINPPTVPPTPTHEASRIFQTVMDDFQTTLFSESARWGDSARPEKAYTFLDPTSFPGRTDRGDWDRTTKYHRDTYIPTRRAIFLNQLIARDLAE